MLKRLPHFASTNNCLFIIKKKKPKAPPLKKMYVCSIWLFAHNIELRYLILFGNKYALKKRKYFKKFSIFYLLHVLYNVLNDFIGLFL